MKKIPSINNLSQLKDVFNVNSEITGKIIYSSFIQEMSHEFLDNAPYKIISNIQHNINDDNTILDSISFGNNTNDVIFGFTMSNYYHMKEVLFCILLYFIWFRLMYMTHTMYENIQKALLSPEELQKRDISPPSFQEEMKTKIATYIDLESVKKKMNLILLILFFIFNRNIDNAI